MCPHADGYAALHSIDNTPPTKFCSRETAERMAAAARAQAQHILRQESEEDAPLQAYALPQTLGRFRVSVGVACTAALATNYEKAGPHQCFLSVCKARAVASRGDSAAPALLREQCETYHLNLSKTLKRTRSGALRDWVMGRTGMWCTLTIRSLTPQRKIAS